MASLRVAFAYISISMISVVLFIIFVGVFLRSCFRSTKKTPRPAVNVAFRKESPSPHAKKDYGGATPGADDKGGGFQRGYAAKPAAAPPPDAEAPEDDSAQALLNDASAGTAEHKHYPAPRDHRIPKWRPR